VTPLGGGDAEQATVRVPRPYASPYVAGVGLGLVLLAAFVVAGRGLGVSGAFASATAAAVEAAAPGHARANPYFGAFTGAEGERAPLGDWLVLEVVGVVIGGALSSWLAGRTRRRVDRGPALTNGRRFVWAFAGGALMGFAARLARGCTSGLALTGGALLSVGAWVFMLALFAAGYAAAPLLRRAWR
jgi:hypothetical protein